MTSPLTASPQGSRISVAPSIATTASDPSSNLGSPSIISPMTSGTLSPLGLGGTPAESVSRTFANVLKHQKVMRRSHSAFLSREGEAFVFASSRYQKFQKRVQRAELVPSMERDEQKSPAGGGASSPAEVDRFVFKEKPEKTYFKIFPIKAKLDESGHCLPLPVRNVHVGASAVSEYDKDITACDVGDSIAAFCLSKREVIVHHVSSNAFIKAVCDQFAWFPPDKRFKYQIYLVGGDGSRESVQLLYYINAAIRIFFGKKGVIKETFVHASPGDGSPGDGSPGDDRSCSSISVACTKEKQFFFCRHI